MKAQDLYIPPKSPFGKGGLNPALQVFLPCGSAWCTSFPCPRLLRQLSLRSTIIRCYLSYFLFCIVYICFVFRTPSVIMAQPFLGFTGGGRSALTGGAHFVRFMGSALAFLFSVIRKTRLVSLLRRQRDFRHPRTPRLATWPDAQTCPHDRRLYSGRCVLGAGNLPRLATP